MARMASKIFSLLIVIQALSSLAATESNSYQLPGGSANASEAAGNRAALQRADTGSVNGAVLRAGDEIAVSGALVELVQSGEIKASATTNPDGTYSFPNLSPGIYDIRVTASGYVTEVRVGISVSNRRASRADVKLFSPGSISSISAASANNNVIYIYDELGRLVAVVDPATETAVYAYDAVGNLVSVTRRSSSSVSVIEFTPNGGTIGSPVTIFGTGFSTTPSQNIVKFNGVTATVTSSTSTQINTTVPAGATTGLISVTTPTGSATSSTSFTVGNSTAPTITGFSPMVGVAGTSVTINGTNFETTITNNKVAFNTSRALVNTATATTISTSVPTSATSGHISVATPTGKAISAGDFFVPPSPFTTSDVEFTGRMLIGGSSTVTINTANKIGLMIFDGNAGQRISLQMSGVTIGTSSCCSTFISILNPDASTLVSQTFVGTSGGFIDTKTLPATGTYTIVVDPQSTSTGSITLTLYNVLADVAASITAGGPAVTVATTTPGQNASLTFSGTTGQRVSLQMSGVTIGTSSCCSTFISILNPDASTLVSQTFVGTSGGFIDTNTLPATGTYKIFVDPQSTSTGSITLTLFDVPADINGSITPGGDPVTVTTTISGQNARLTFSGTSGQRVSLQMSGVTIGTSSCCSTFISILNPDASTLVPQTFVGTSGGFIDTKTLPATGTYTIVVDPQSTSTGSITLTLFDVPADPSSTITTGGSPVTVTTTTSGQNATLTFSGTSGQRVSLQMTGVTIGTSSCCSTFISILNPDASTLVPQTFVGTSGGFIDTKTLPATGTYTIVVDPQGASTGSITLTLYDIVDVTGSLIINDPPANVPIPTPGQNAQLSFSGTSGQQVTVRVTNNTMSCVTVALIKPDGSQLTSTFSCGASFNLTTQTLLTTGTYLVTINPNGANTGSLSVAVTNP